jgi:hypothetical protein
MFQSREALLPTATLGKRAVGENNFQFYREIHPLFIIIPEFFLSE